MSSIGDWLRMRLGSESRPLDWDRAAAAAIIAVLVRTAVLVAMGLGVFGDASRTTDIGVGMTLAPRLVFVGAAVLLIATWSRRRSIRTFQLAIPVLLVAVPLTFSGAPSWEHPAAWLREAAWFAASIVVGTAVGQSARNRRAARLDGRGAAVSR